MPLRAVFFGTPEFAIPSLTAMLAAESRGIPVARPERLRGNQEVLERIRRVAPDAGVVVAYGKLLPSDVLEVPRLSFVNVHASLLPKYRGASPVQAALLAGDRETGVVTMKVVEELDAGPLYLERRVEVGEREDAGALSQRLARAGADLLIETLAGLEQGGLIARPQQGAPSFCRPMRREDGRIDWTRPATEIDRRLRAYTPWPGAYTFLGVERVKIHGLEPGPETNQEPGTLWLEEDRALVAAGQGQSVLLTGAQRAGRRLVGGAEFARGIRTLPAKFS